MADIFLSYAHVDRPRARPIVTLFESDGWTVWWDRGIEPGQLWEPELDAELARSRAVVLLWSEVSEQSEWVRREAAAGLEKGVLVPILLDATALPQEFANRQVTDLSAWKGETSFHEVQALLRRVSSLVPPSRIDTVRPGYDSQFLGEPLTIPLPGVTGSAAVFRYLHFTVVMNPGRRLAHYVAYNVDATKLRQVPRGVDKWSADPLLPPPLQINAALLRQSKYDRGALVARSTVSWGDEREASIAARQAFFWTNVAPQHQLLNRAWWLALEDSERKLAATHGRISGFSGPVFSDHDEPFRGEVELEDGLVAYDAFRVPRAYWKVIAAAPNARLTVAAYLMDQVAMVEKGVGRQIDVEDYRISLRDLESAAQLRFSPLLHSAIDLREHA